MIRINRLRLTFVAKHVWKTWRKEKMKKLAFGVPMVWREGKDQMVDCYFRMTN